MSVHMDLFEHCYGSGHVLNALSDKEVVHKVHCQIEPLS